MWSESSTPALVARETRAVLAVSGARLRARPLRSALVVAGVALAFAMLVGVLGGSLVARQQALVRALSALPDSARRFRIDRFGLPLSQAAYARADRQAQAAFRTLSGSGARRVILLRELIVDGHLVEIAAVDDLASAVTVTRGHLPRTCTVRSCQVIQIGSRGAARLHEGEITLTRTGVASLKDRALFDSISAAFSGDRRAPVLLLAPAVDSIQNLASLASYYRIYSWLSPLAATQIRTWDINRIRTAESRAQGPLYRADPAFKLSGPDDVLDAAGQAGTVAAHRLLLVGGDTSALLLGFAVIAALGLRRGLGAERRRLLARGARRWQVELGRTAEVAAMTLSGALLGVAAGAGVVAVVAGAAGQPAGSILEHALVNGPALLMLLGGWAICTALLSLATASSGESEKRTRVGIADVAAVGAALTVALSVSRGALDPTSDSAGNRALLLVLPILVCFIAAVVVARLLGPAMRLADRATRGRGISLRLAILALVRAPARTVTSCAFIAVALGLGFFAESYRATLSRGAADQAAFQAPADFVLGEGPRLVLPLDAAPVDRYRALNGVEAAFPVTRIAMTTPGLGSTVLSPTVLGVPAAAVSRLRWRSDYSRLSRRAIAKAIARNGEPRLRGVALPAGTSTVSVHARLRGVGLVLRLAIADARGRERLVTLGHLEPNAERTLTARVDAVPGDALAGITIALPESEQFFLAHRETEGQVAVAPSGTLALGPLRLPGFVRWRDWRLPLGQATLAGGTARLDYSFPDTGATLVFRPRQGTDDRLMPAVVSPDIAAAAGGIGKEATFDFGDGTVNAEIVGVARRLPTVPASTGPFALVDQSWLATAVDSAAPGEGTPNEVWLAAADDRAAAAALAKPPFSSLAAVSRQAVERELRSDPLARATVFVLLGAAVVALALAILGLWVGLVSELRDERSDFFDLEVRGVAPARLRSQIVARSALLTAVGALGGLALGLILSRLVVSLVRVSANSAVPEPPLRLVTGWSVVLVALVAFGAVTFLVAELTARAAFRGHRPARASWSLE